MAAVLEYVDGEIRNEWLHGLDLFGCDENVIRRTNKERRDIDLLVNTLKRFPVMRPIAIPVDRPGKATAGECVCIVVALFVAEQRVSSGYFAGHGL